MVTLHDGSVHHITDGRPALQPNAADSAAGQRFIDAEVEEEYGIEATIDADGQLIVTGNSLLKLSLPSLYSLNSIAS